MSDVSFTKENIYYTVSWFHVLLNLRVFDNKHTRHRETVITQWCAALNFMIAVFGEPTESQCEHRECFEYSYACARLSFAREHDERLARAAARREYDARLARAARCVAEAKRKVLCDRHAEDAMCDTMLRRGMCRADVECWVWAFSESDAAAAGLSVLLQWRVL